MSKSSDLIRKYADIIALAENRRSAVDQMPQGFGAGAGNIPIPRAPGEKFAVPGAAAIVGTPLAATALLNKGNEPNQAKPQTSTGSSGRGNLGMPQAKPGEGSAVVTGKGLQGTTNLAQGPKTADALAKYSKGMFATRADRLDQAKVDSVLGAGRYRAGSAEANQALATHFLTQQVFQDNLARARAESERQQPRQQALALQNQEREVQRQELEFRQQDQQ